MTSFVQIQYPQQHPGVARAEAVIEAAGRLRRGFDGTRSIAAVLLAAIVAALVVVADQLVDRWTGGRLLAAWVVLWAVAFAALGLFAGSARRMAVAMVKQLDAWSSRVAQSRADERLWATAQADPRVMADLRAAMARSDAPAPRIAAALRTGDVPARRSLRQAYQDWRRDLERARADVAYLAVAGSDPRVMAELRAAQSRASVDMPGQTQTLQRADAAVQQRDEARANAVRYANYAM